MTPDDPQTLEELAWLVVDGWRRIPLPEWKVEELAARCGWRIEPDDRIVQLESGEPLTPEYFLRARINDPVADVLADAYPELVGDD